MSAWIILQRMLVLFAMMLIGYFCARGKWLDENAYGKLSKIVVNVMNPLLIINGVLNKNIGDASSQVVQNLILTAVYFAVLIIISIPAAKLLRVKASEQSLYRLMFIFSNVGFMGIPVIGSLYGETSMIYIAFYILGYNLLLYTYGILLTKKSCNDGNRKGHSFQFKSIINAGVIACLVSIVLFVCKVQVPSAVESFVSYMGNAAVPCSMILIGASVAQQDFKELFRDYKMYIFLGVRLLAVPILVTLLARRLPFDAQLIGIFCLMFAMPVGSIVVLLASEHGADDKLCTRGSVLSTLLSVLTIPIVALFL